MMKIDKKKFIQNIQSFDTLKQIKQFKDTNLLKKNIMIYCQENKCIYSYISDNIINTYRPEDRVNHIVCKTCGTKIPLEESSIVQCTKCGAIYDYDEEAYKQFFIKEQDN